MKNDQLLETQKLILADKGTKFGHNIIETYVVMDRNKK